MTKTVEWARRVLLSRVAQGTESVDDLVEAIRRVADDLDEEEDPIDPTHLYVEPVSGNILCVTGIPSPDLLPYRGDGA